MLISEWRSFLSIEYIFIMLFLYSVYIYISYSVQFCNRWDLLTKVTVWINAENMAFTRHQLDSEPVNTIGGSWFILGFRQSFISNFCNYEIRLIHTNNLKMFYLYLFFFYFFMGWSLLPNALRPFKIYCAPPNLSITRTWICLLNFAQCWIFSGLRFFNEPEISHSVLPA